MEIAVGMTHTSAITVTKDKTARAVGSGDLEVLATPMLAALMENAAAKAIEPALAKDKTSVGISLQIFHTSATPVGIQAEATAIVNKVEGNKVEFSITAKDKGGEIGTATHTRVVVDAVRFMDKAIEKIGS